MQRGFGKFVSYFKTLIPSAVVAFSLGCTKAQPAQPVDQQAPSTIGMNGGTAINRDNKDALIARASRLEDVLEDLAEDVEHIHLARPETASRAQNEYENLLEAYQQTCRTLERENVDYTPRDFPAIAELLQRSEQFEVVENLQRFRNASQDISDAVENLENDRLTIRQFMRELRAYEGARGRYMQALNLLARKNALPLLFSSPQSLLQLRWTAPAVPDYFLSLARNEPLHTSGIFHGVNGDLEYGFTDNEDGIRREYFSFISQMEGQNRQVILMYSNGVLTKQTNVLLPDYRIRQEFIPAARTVEFATHPMLRHLIGLPDEFLEATRRGETVTLEQFFLDGDEQYNVEHELFARVRKESVVNLDFLNVQTILPEGNLTNYVLSRQGLRENMRLFNLTEPQHAKIICVDDEIVFDYSDHVQTLTFVRGQHRGHLIQTMLRNNQQIYSCDWYLDGGILQNAVRTIQGDCDHLSIALSAQTQLEQLPPILPHVHLFESRCELRTEGDDEVREQMLGYYLDLKVVAEHFGEVEQAKYFEDVLRRLSR